MGWSLTTHRCLRPTVDQAEEIGAGIGSVWQCGTCQATYRIADFDISTSAGGYMQPSVRWEIVSYGVATR
jgi:ribosomal protein L37AE/L43A